MKKEDLENNLIRVQDWIKSADQKVSIWLAFQGIFLTIIIQYIANKIKNVKYFDFNILLFLTSITLIGLSIYKAALVIVPRIKNGKHKSILYFGDIGSISLNDYENIIKKYSEADFERDLISQIHISSKIAKRKHEEFRDSLILFIVGSVLLALFYLIN
jgi:hypothetical protein